MSGALAVLPQWCLVKALTSVEETFQPPPGFGNDWLTRMHEVILPAPLPWEWPALGWWLLAFVVAWLLLGLGVRRYWRWQDNAYRRQACAAIRACRQSLSQLSLSQLQGQPRQQALAELQRLPALIKGVALHSLALAGLPRTQVSGLSATQWQQWLDLHRGKSGGGRYSLGAQPALAERFRSLAFVSADTLASWPTDELASLLQWCDDWVRHHRVVEPAKVKLRPTIGGRQRAAKEHRR